VIVDFYYRLWRVDVYALLLAEAQREGLERFVHRDSLVGMWPRLRRLPGPPARREWERRLMTSASWRALDGRRHDQALDLILDHLAGINNVLRGWFDDLARRIATAAEPPSSQEIRKVSIIDAERFMTG
jgi:hypothetical protein